METPTFSNNFNQALLHVIYKISGAGTHYIGMTLDFNREMTVHQNAVLNDSESPFYAFIRDNGGWGSFHKEILEASVLHRDEALIRLAERIREQSQVETYAEPKEEPKYPSDIIRPIKFVPKKRLKLTPEERVEYKRVYNQKWREKNADRYKTYLQEWRKANPSYHKEWEAKAKQVRNQASTAV